MSYYPSLVLVVKNSYEMSMSCCKVVHIHQDDGVLVFTCFRFVVPSAHLYFALKALGYSNINFKF